MERETVTSIRNDTRKSLEEGQQLMNDLNIQMKTVLIQYEKEKKKHHDVRQVYQETLETHQVLTAQSKDWNTQV